MMTDGHITCRYMSKYEFARVVGLRALQLTSDADLSGVEAHSRAVADVIGRRLNWSLRRYLPDGTHEDCNIRDLLIDRQRILLSGSCLASHIAQGHSGPAHLDAG